MVTRRQFVAAAGSSFALAGCLGDGGSDDPAGTVTVPDAPVPDGPVANAPVPDDAPEGYTYATMGSGDGPTVRYYGNWKCPYCAQFSTGFLSDLVTDYVEPGDVDLEYRALSYFDGEPFLGADAPRAARAGLAVWNVDPGSYWTFHEYVMANQPPEAQAWATTDTLVAFAEAAGVEGVDAVREEIESGAYETAVTDTSDAASAAGVDSTPALVIDGEALNPLGDQERVRSLIEGLADGG